MKGRKILLAFSLLLVTAHPTFADEKTLVQDGSVTYKLYTVKRGDSIWKISEKELQDAARWKEILVPKTISITDSVPDLILPGQFLFLPILQGGYEDGDDPSAGNEGNAGGSGQAPTSETIQRVAVKEFAYDVQDPALAWLPHGLAETMTADLKKFPNITVTDGNHPDEHADAVISGSITEADAGVTIQAVLTSAESKQGIAEARISGSLQKLVDLSRIVLIKLLERTADLSGDAQADIMGRGKPSLGALENISKADLLGSHGDEAKELYRRALVSDPTNSAALERLKENLSPGEALAVLPLANVTGKQEHNWLGMGIAEALTTDLKKASGVNLVERMQVDKALTELKLSSVGGLVDEKTAPALGKMTGAAIVLIGSFQVENQNIRMDVRMVDVASGIVLLTESVSGAYEMLFQVETSLAEKISEALNVQLTPEQKKTMGEGKGDIASFKQHILATSSLTIDKRQSNSSRVRSLAILQFDNASKTTEFDWLRQALPGSLTTDISAKTRIPLVERMQID